MKLGQAKEILRNYIRTDRVMRDYNDTTDYERFCEERCLAMEVILEELEKERCQCPQK